MWGTNVTVNVPDVPDMMMVKLLEYCQSRHRQLLQTCLLLALYVGINNASEIKQADTICMNQGIPFNETVLAPRFASGILQVPSLANTSRTFHCRILLGTRAKGFRVRLAFNATLRPSPNLSCETDYIHVGNSRYTIDMKTVTSYKFCGGTQLQEVVSRGQVLWVVLRSMSEGYFSGLNFRYDILPNDPCDNGSYFRCSPVECIRSDFRCDGQIHCSNARDEYCDRLMSSPDSSCSSPMTPGKLATHLNLALPPSLHGGTECFLCEDGTCIRPTLPIYHFNHGQPWWWLCDKIAHCLDGTDERMDVCQTMRSRTSSLYYCPTSTNWSRETELQAVMWQRFVCDSVVHCHGGEDESEDECFRDEDHFALNSKIAIPLTAFIIFSTFTALLYNREKFRMKACKQNSTDSDAATQDSQNQRGARARNTNNDIEAIPSTSKDQSHPNYFILSQTAV